LVNEKILKPGVIAKPYNLLTLMQQTQTIGDIWLLLILSEIKKCPK
jgi:hypothetical protein